MHGHFDFKCVALAGVLPPGKSWPQFTLAAGVVTDSDDKAYDDWVASAQWLAFANIRLAESDKKRRHAPAVVTPFVVSAGGGVLDATDHMLPTPSGRNGRHYQRQHLSGVLVSYLHALNAEFASRNCAATAVEDP